MTDIAIISKDGALRLVLSEFGVVVYQNSVRLPHRPTAANMASSMRVLADALSLYSEKQKGGPDKSRPD
jgi:hypothetical protein